MRTHTLFISDLHLDTTHSATADLFLNFLKMRAPQAEALYILGDFFEVWLGDDDTTPFNERIKQGLIQLTNRGFPVYFMHGNRDLLLGEKFLKATGCQLLRDPTVIDLYGVPTLLMHGDSLCVDDKMHRLFRHISHHPHVQALVLALPLHYRRALLKQLRKRSQQRTRRVSDAILDVNQQAVQQAMKDFNVSQLIHGHTHRPATHTVTLQAGQVGKRIVLGAWEKTVHALVYESDGNHYEFTG